MKGKNHIGKGKHTAKIVNQPLIKLVGRLKDKSSKIIYVYNKQLQDTHMQKDVKYDIKYIKYGWGSKTAGLLECVQT